MGRCPSLTCTLGLSSQGNERILDFPRRGLAPSGSWLGCSKVLVRDCLGRPRPLLGGSGAWVGVPSAVSPAGAGRLSGKVSGCEFVMVWAGVPSVLAASWGL